MEVIVSHVNLDFDGLASMVAARKLFPHAVIVLPDKLSLGVKKFVALYKDSLRLEFPPSPVGFQPDRVVVVDANAPERLGEVARQWVQEEGVKVYVYDHHPPAKEEIRADRRLVLPVGSTTAILVEELARRSLFLSGLEATLMALGIYEDTGHLTFSNTT
ncbi:MAG: DHH family phosphoesterase, partial [Clostridia bacterium]|nr:DHH family phosphoesterase [Clostridia bacterium]